MPETAEVQKPAHNPFFSEEEMKKIKQDAPRAWNKETPKELQSDPYWEAVDAAFILKNRGGYDEKDMLVYSKRDKKGRIESVLLVKGGQVVYPAFIEEPDREALGVEFDEVLSLSLRNSASRVSPQRSSLQSQPTR